MAKSPTEPTEEFHPIDAAARRQRLPIAEVARQAGIRRVLVHQVIAGEEGREFTDDEWARIAAVLGVTTEYLQGPNRRLVDEPIDLKSATVTR